MWRRIIQGLAAGAYAQLVTAIIQLAGVPILLHAWGTQLYGEWLILFAIPSYLAMSDFGFAQSAANDMSAHLARNDTDRALAVFQSLSMLLGTVIIGCVILSTTVVWLLPTVRSFHFTLLDEHAIRWILWLLAGEVAIGLVDGVNHAGFRSHGDYGFHATLTATVLLLQYVAVWAMALLGQGAIAAACAFLLTRVVAAPVTVALLLYRHPSLRLGFQHAQVAELRRLAKPAIANLAIPLATGLNIQGMVLIIGAALGPVAVVVFSTLRTLSRVTLQAVQRVAYSFEPELAAAWGSGNRALLSRLYQHSQRIGLWLALLAVVVLWEIGPWLLRIWTHDRIAMDPLLFGCLLASALASAFWYAALILIRAGNAHLRASMWYVFSNAVAVLLAAALLHRTSQLASAGVALLFADFFMTMYLSRAAGRLLRCSQATLLLQVVSPRPIVNGVVSALARHARKT